MTRTLRTLLRSATLSAATLCMSLAASHAFAQAASTTPPAGGPPVLFRAALPEVPGSELVVVALTLAPRRANQPPSPGHRHPGSVYVYVTAGTARLAIDGKPAVEVKTGESFFEPPGALHTIAESAHPTESASAIAVMIVPVGAPLVLPADQH